mmetsp:Transcript_24545/g.78934  ORF Transcript_24545/g.78934 Transcript_24545/m.78934 type:complete len:542 (-) Transcript_24545:310-1935(-)
MAASVQYSSCDPHSCACSSRPVSSRRESTGITSSNPARNARSCGSTASTSNARSARSTYSPRLSSVTSAGSSLAPRSAVASASPLPDPTAPASAPAPVPAPAPAAAAEPAFPATSPVPPVCSPTTPRMVGSAAPARCSSTTCGAPGSANTSIASATSSRSCCTLARRWGRDSAGSCSSAWCSWCSARSWPRDRPIAGSTAATSSAPSGSPTSHLHAGSASGRSAVCPSCSALPMARPAVRITAASARRASPLASARGSGTRGNRPRGASTYGPAALPSDRHAPSSWRCSSRHSTVKNSRVGPSPCPSSPANSTASDACCTGGSASRAAPPSSTRSRDTTARCCSSRPNVCSPSRPPRRRSEPPSSVAPSCAAATARELPNPPHCSARRRSGSGTSRRPNPPASTCAQAGIAPVVAVSGRVSWPSSLSPSRAAAKSAARAPPPTPPAARTCASAASSSWASAPLSDGRHAHASDTVSSHTPLRSHSSRSSVSDGAARRPNARAASRPSPLAAAAPASEQPPSRLPPGRSTSSRRCRVPHTRS